MRVELVVHYEHSLEPTLDRLWLVFKHYDETQFDYKGHNTAVKTTRAWTTFPQNAAHSQGTPESFAVYFNNKQDALHWRMQMKLGETSERDSQRSDWDTDAGNKQVGNKDDQCGEQFGVCFPRSLDDDEYKSILGSEVVRQPSITTSTKKLKSGSSPAAKKSDKEGRDDKSRSCKDIKKKVEGDQEEKTKIEELEEKKEEDRKKQEEKRRIEAIEKARKEARQAKKAAETSRRKEEKKKKKDEENKKREAKKNKKAEKKKNKQMLTTG